MASKGTILWHSNGPTYPTGYGNQTALFAPRIEKAGYEVVLSSFTDEGAPFINPLGLRTYPRYQHLYGGDVLRGHYHQSKADLLMSLVDSFAIPLEAVQGLNWAALAPEDAEPLKYGNAKHLKAATWQIAISQHGLNLLQAAGFKDALYVPHGVDIKVFKPVDRAKARQEIAEHFKLDLTDKFIAVYNMANKCPPEGTHRKNPGGTLAAFAEFAQDKDDAVLIIHTDPESKIGQNLLAYLDGYGLRGKVFFPNRYLYGIGAYTQEYLNNLYNAADVYLHIALGEGFGIPLIEAQAAGTPVITTAGTAMNELCLSGHRIPAIPFHANVEATCWFLPLQGEVVKALNTRYVKRHDDSVAREKARALALAYDIDNVMDSYMLPVLETIFKDINKQKQMQAIKIIPPRRKQPDVSVVIPAYNCIDTIDKAVHSALKQDVELEVIIVEDRSTDTTWKHVKKWIKHQKVKVMRTDSPGGGPVGALNVGCAAAKGRYLIKLDSDDWLHEGALAAMVAALDNNPDVGFVYGQCQYHGKMQNLYTPPAFNADEFWYRNAAIGEVMYRASAHKKGLRHYGFRKRGEREFGPHDWDFVLQMIHILGWKGLALPEVLVLHYQHEDGTASHDTKQVSSEVIQAFNQKWQGKVKAVAI